MMFGSYMTDPSRNKEVSGNFVEIQQPDDMVQAMYVWIDGSGEGLRCKTKTLTFEPKTSSDCPEWNYDGSSTGQATGKNSDTYLRPVRLFNDPFRGGKNKLVMCDTYKFDDTPTDTNKRQSCVEVMKKVLDENPLFSIDQEFTLMEQDRHPLGWPKNGFPAEEGPYFCGIGADNVYGRDVMEAFYRACLYAGITLDGSNPNKMPAQWQFNVGPCEGIDMGDELWMARFVLTRVAEDFGVLVSFDPKPVPGKWNGSGAFCNFSTKHMRRPSGLKDIEKAFDKLATSGAQNQELYDPKGKSDRTKKLAKEKRQKGDDISDDGPSSAFKATRRGSVQIPQNVGIAGKGFIEDRRPASNCDPYAITEMIVCTTILSMQHSGIEEISDEDNSSDGN